MAIFDLFSKRQKRLRKEGPDVYSYDNIPKPLRVQVVHIWQEVLGSEDQRSIGEVRHWYTEIVTTLCKEYGVFQLVPTSGYSNRHYMSW